MENTKKGKIWEITHSLWIIWSFIIAANGLGLMIAGIKTHVKKWRNAGLLYIVLTWIGVYSISESTKILSNILAILILGLYLACIIHSFTIRKEYLVRLELLVDQKIDQQKTDELRNQAMRDYGIRTNNTDDVALQENTTSINEKKDVININPSNSNQSVTSLLDINACTQEDLLQLPGVGIIEVKKVIDFRNKNEFNSVEEFIEVLSMKPHFVEQIRPKLICNKVHNNLVDDNEKVDNEKVDNENNKDNHMGRMVDF